MKRSLEPGHPFPLGASVSASGVNFAIFSHHAERIELCLFSEDGKREVDRLDMPRRSNDIWHGFLRGAQAGLRYGYRVHGKYDPEAGHRFNHHKLLIDPYTRALDGELVWSDANYGYVRDSEEGDLSFDTRDSAPYIPKCIVTDLSVTPIEQKRPRWRWSNAIVYEAHVKGLSKQLECLPESIRGTYAALGQPEIKDYLTNLGINTIELLPIHGFADDDFLSAKDLRNYWGYQTLTFMAPANRYASSTDPAAEFRTAVASLHDVDIKVLLDVVYNHSGEGHELGPTLCYRGIDNYSYYRLKKNRRYYVNDTGTGNTLRVEHPRVLQMIMDSLRFWHNEMGVDGFRFDLASVLGREAHGFDQGSGFFDAIEQDPSLQGAHMIAEPWDLGPGGYQLGHYPRRWSEWNDKYRDTVRQFWLGNNPVRADFAKRLLGSSEIFEHAGGTHLHSPHNTRSPASSINFVTAHDGYCLRDLVSYEQKHNLANGENNLDGHNGEVSNNHGAEGPVDDKEINTLRARQQRNLLTSLMVSQGIPMMLAGDERSRSQLGNNNAYCQDNETAWIDWSTTEQASNLTQFVRYLITLRKRFPVLQRPWYLHAQHVSASGHADVIWLHESGHAMSVSDWHDSDGRFLAVQLAGDSDAEHSYYGPAEHGASLLMMFNSSTQSITFPLTGTNLIPGSWYLELDSSDEQWVSQEPAKKQDTSVICQAQSVLILSNPHT